MEVHALMSQHKAYTMYYNIRGNSHILMTSVGAWLRLNIIQNWINALQYIIVLNMY